MVIQRSFFDCPTVSVIPEKSNNSNSSSLASWTPPPSIPNGFQLALKNNNDNTNNNRRVDSHQHKMITFALGKIFCYSCIGNITNCVKDEILIPSSSSSSSSSNKNPFQKIQPVAVTATRIPIDVLSVVVSCGEDYDPDASSSPNSILVRQELWSLCDRIIEVVTGPKCEEKLCCLLDNHPLAPPLSSVAASSYHFLVENVHKSMTNSKNRQRSFLVFESSESKEALDLVQQEKDEKQLEEQEQQKRNDNRNNNNKSKSTQNIIVNDEDDEYVPQKSKSGKKLEFVIEGMSCASCAKNIENTINKKYSGSSSASAYLMVPNSISCSFAACSASVIENENLSDESRRQLAKEIQQIISGLGFKCTPLLQRSSSSSSKRKVYDFSNSTTNNKIAMNPGDGDDHDNNLTGDEGDGDDDNDSDDENRLTRRAIEREEEITALTKSTMIAVAGGAPLLLMMILMMSLNGKNSSGNSFYRIMHLRLMGNVSFENFISLILATPVVWYAGRPFFQRAWNLFTITAAAASSTTPSSSSNSNNDCSFAYSCFEFLSNSGMNMDTLVSVGVGVSYFTSLWLFLFDLFSSPDSSSSFSHNNMNFDTAAVLLAFVCFGKLLEAKAKRMTGDALISLMKLTPKSATLITTATTNTNTDNTNNNNLSLQQQQQQPIIISSRTSILTKHLQIGNLVEVLPGNSIPTDGIVVDGTTEVGEALVTGESLPVRKEIGSPVIGGTQNFSHPIIFRVTKVGKNTVVANILQIVRTAQQSKPTILRVTDKIAAVFVPVVLILACIVFCVWAALGFLNLYPEEWRRLVVANGNGNNMKHEGHATASCSPFSFAFSFALATVVVACPCALGLAAPTAIMVGTGVGAQNGILLKSAEAMERANSVDCVVFDKTGTLTTGKMTVKKVKVHRGLLLLQKNSTSSSTADVTTTSEFPNVNFGTKSVDEAIPPVSPSTKKMISHRVDKPLPSTDSITFEEDVVTVSSIGRQHLKKKLKQANEEFDDDDLNLLMNSSLLMSCVASLESKSLHPIAKAICRYSSKQMRNYRPRHSRKITASSSSDDDEEETFFEDNNNNNDDDNDKCFQNDESKVISSMTEWKQIPGRGISANVQLQNSCWKRVAVGSLQFLQQDEKCSNAFSDEAVRVASSSTTFEPSSKKKKRALNMIIMNARNNSNDSGAHHLLSSPSSSENNEINTNNNDSDQKMIASSSSSEAEVVICVAVDRKFVATIHLSDTIKKDAAATISYLRQVVNAQVWMVTGDTAEAAKSVAERIGISPFKVLSSRLPDQKVEAVRLLQQHKGRKVVAFVGDGINDAGALSQANLGIAIGAGTDVAIDAADAVLVQDRLFNVCTVIDLAKTTIRRIYINFLWAVIYNLIMLPLSCGMFFWIIKKQLPPVVAGAAMMCSSLSVVGSSLMLKWYSAPRFRNEPKKQQLNHDDDDQSEDGENLISSLFRGIFGSTSKKKNNSSNSNTKDRMSSRGKKRRISSQSKNDDDENDSVKLLDK